MVYCCVPFCKSNAKNSTKPKTSFHQFPCDEYLRRQWLRRIARKDFIINDKSGSSVVCSKHFTQNDYVLYNINGYERLQNTRLKKQAVPTVFPMYPSYALLQPPDNYLSLDNLNHVKCPSIVKDKTKNSRKKVLRNVVVKSCMNSTNNLVEQQHVDRVFTIKKAKEYTPDLPAANNSRSLVCLNHVKITSMVETVTENSTKIIPVDATFSSDMTSTNKNSREKQHEDCASMIKKAKNEPPVANNNCSSISLIHMKRPSMEIIKKSIKIVPIDISVDCDMTSTNKNPHEDHACIIKKGKKDPHAAKINRSCVSLTPVKRPSFVATVAENSTKIAPVDPFFNCDTTSTNTNSREDHVFTIESAKENTPKANNKRSCVSLNHVKRPSTVETVTENSTQINHVDITINSDMTSNNNISREQQCKDNVFMFKKAKKDTATANNNPSYVSLNQRKSSSMVEDETQNLTKALIDSAVNSHMTSTNKSLVKLQHKDRVFTIKKVTEDPSTVNNRSSVILIYLKKPSTMGTVVKNSRKIDPLNINIYSDMQRYEDRSCVSLNHVKTAPTVETVTEYSTKIIPINLNSDLTSINNNLGEQKHEDVNIAFNSDVTSTNNNNLREQQHADHACIIKKAKKDRPAVNINRSRVSLNRVKRPSMVETVTENSTKTVPVDIAINSDMTSTNNNNLREQQHEDRASMIKKAKKDPSAANINRSSVSLIPVKRLSMVTSTNNNFIEQQHKDGESVEKETDNSIKIAIQTKVRDQQIQIKRLRNFLWKKNQKLKIMKEEMDMMEKKVSFYKNNGQYKILRKALAFKDNCSQTNFIFDQL